MRLDELIGLYLGHIRTRLRSHRHKAGILAKWVGIFGADRDATTIRRVDIARAVSQLQADGLKASSINTYLTALSAVYKYAIRLIELDTRNPCAEQFLRLPEWPTRHLSSDQLFRLIDAAETTYRKWYVGPYVMLVANTGMRKMEAARLQWAAVDMQGPEIHLAGSETKTRRGRIIPLNDWAMHALLICQSHHTKHCPLSPWVFTWTTGKPILNIYQAVKSAARRAGIEHCTIHALRHTFASLLVQEEIPLIEVRDLLGHSSVKETERYAHLSRKCLHRAVSALDRL